MKYFILEMDKQFVHAPIIKNWYGRINKKEISIDKAYLLPKRTVIEIESNPNIVFTDIITTPFFLVSKPLKKVIEAYEPTTLFKGVILFDRPPNAVHQLYYMPILDKIDCLSEESELNLDRSYIKKAVIKPDRTQNKSIFWLDKVSRTYTIVRLDLIESILRRTNSGIILTEVGLSN